MIKWKYLIGVFSVVLAVISIKANALECNEDSPYLKIEGDDYYQMLKTPALSRQKEALIKKIFYPLSKTMKGSVVEIECSLPEYQAKKIVKRKKVTADISYFSGGNVTIQLEVEDVKAKTNTLGVLTFFNKNVSYRILGITESEVTVLSKSRKSNGRKAASHLVEEIAHIAVSKWNVDIEIVRYINGYFSESRHYKLNR